MFGTKNITGLLALMAIIPWSDVGNAPFDSSTPLGQIISTGRSALCGLYQNYPGFGLPDPTGIGAVSRALWDRVCGSPQTPPVPINPPIQGGKCKCTLYRVSYTFRVFPNPPSSEEIFLYGPIRIMGWNGSQLGTGLDFVVYSGDAACFGRVRTNLLGQADPQRVGSGETFARITAITALNGGPDDCGGQPPIYVPQAPTVPDLNFRAPVTFSPGFTIPVAFIYIRPNFDVNLSPNFNFDFNPTFNLPDLNFNIGFSLGGVTINLNGDLGGDPYIPLPDPRPNPPPRLPDPGNPQDLSEVYRRLDRLQKDLQDLEDCTCIDFTGLVQSQIGTGGGGTANLPARTRYIRVQVTTIPRNSRNWFGRGAPDVENCGWAWFGYNASGQAVRLPIDAVNKTFLVPPGATSFSWTTYSNGNATVTAFRKL